MDFFLLLIIILQQTLFLRTPVAGASVPSSPAGQFPMWHETSEGHVCSQAWPHLPHAAKEQDPGGERRASDLSEVLQLFVSQPAASLITKLELFAPVGKGKKKGFRAVCSFSGFHSSSISYLPLIDLYL